MVNVPLMFVINIHVLCRAFIIIINIPIMFIALLRGRGHGGTVPAGQSRRQDHSGAVIAARRESLAPELASLASRRRHMIK